MRGSFLLFIAASCSDILTTVWYFILVPSSRTRGNLRSLQEDPTAFVHLSQLNIWLCPFPGLDRVECLAPYDRHKQFTSIGRNAWCFCDNVSCEAQLMSNVDICGRSAFWLMWLMAEKLVRKIDGKLPAASADFTIRTICWQFSVG